MRREEFTVAGKGEPSTVLLPGWATDGRIFEGALPGITAVATGPLRPVGFTARLAKFLDRAANGPVTLVGWSLGGFLAADFAREYPDRVRRVVLVGIRRRYPEGDVDVVRRSLSVDPERCLSGFYAQCFYPSHIPAYRRFRAGLQETYLREMDVDALREGLSYLAGARLSGGTLPPCPVAIVHGGKDVVAPFAEAEDVAREGGNATFHPLPGAAHAAFLADGFRAVAPTAKDGLVPLRAGMPRVSMERPMVDPAVLRRFSSGAVRYEAHAHAQRLSAVDLLAYTEASLGPVRPRTVLEPGCGTGLYTRMLLDAFPGASMFAVDISEAMVRVAKRGVDDPRVRFAVADAEEIATGSYDLVTSNAVFQWFLSLPRTLARMSSLLPGGGLLTFSFFGPGTYAELDDAMRASAVRRGREDGARVAAAAFHSREEISEALSDSFPRWDVAERRYRQEFPTLADLLRSIRYTGTRGNGPREPWSPGKLARVEGAYRERSGGIKATYQVFLCRGMMPGGRTG